VLRLRHCRWRRVGHARHVHGGHGRSGRGSGARGVAQAARVRRRHRGLRGDHRAGADDARRVPRGASGVRRSAL